ncbi:MAG: MbnP family protein [Chitinophagales bacterium]
MALLVLSSCHKPDGKLSLQMQAVYGNQAFFTGTSNTDAQNRRIQTDVLKFYLSHITLIKTDNSEVEVKDVALIDFSNPSSLSINVDKLNGDFKAIRFGIGVDSIQNESDPNDIDPKSPLANNDMYWSWMKYIFVKYEARCDTSGTGSGTYNWFPLYHLGSNPLYRTVTLTKDFSACCGDKQSLTLVLDVKKIFYGDTETLDLINESTSQTSDHFDVATKFMNNLAKAFSLN